MAASPLTKARKARNLVPHGLLTIHEWMQQHGDAELTARAHAVILATDVAVTNAREEDGLTPHQVAERVVTPIWREACAQQAAADAAVNAVFDTWNNRQLEVARHKPGHIQVLYEWLHGKAYFTATETSPTTLPMAFLYKKACELNLPSRVRLLYAHGNASEYAALRTWQQTRANSMHAANASALAVHALLYPLTREGVSEGM